MMCFLILLLVDLPSFKFQKVLLILYLFVTHFVILQQVRNFQVLHIGSLKSRQKKQKKKFGNILYKATMKPISRYIAILFMAALRNITTPRL